MSWESTPGGVDRAIDLIKLIRKEHGDYFGIAVAGFPEGHPQSRDEAQTDELLYLKAKVDAGADFILTEFFYDPDVFINFQTRCKDAGIHCPIVPGMMPIQSFSGLQQLTKHLRIYVPDKIWSDLAPIRDDDEQVQAYGVKLCTEMCDTLGKNGVKGFHFFTFNLQASAMAVLTNLGANESAASRRDYPWRGSRSNSNGALEDVRPINWANRPREYIQRTDNWDNFPNGRWGDNRSPAYGELSDSHHFRPHHPKSHLLAMWGEAPILHQEIYEVFAKFIEGEIPILPWCEELTVQAETTAISPQLAKINRQGFLTINSQPAVNGQKSDHPLYGWGGPGGRVYQKAYVEFFVSPQRLPAIMEVINSHSNLNYYAIDSNGAEFSSGFKSVIALTWGCFPNKEILQPTVFDHDSFVVWSKEVFQLWTKSWAALYDDETESSALLYDIYETFFLVAIIDNDYIDSDLFRYFEEIIIADRLDAANQGRTDESEDGSVISGIEMD
eukprot:gene22768-28930_t